jgi:hypothetical protein
MPTFQISFTIDPDALPIVDKLRDSISREQFFRYALELGLCEILESATRVHRDMALSLLAGTTFDYKQARTALFHVGDPENVVTIKPKTT